ncbi:MAG: hypothetical protein HXY34_00355 [Candidatus Thorarchaeota archaeon]|nr:hypothetical protein [Candidatus Thorarchaeota archaeon]
MQEFLELAALLREVSLAIFLLGLFYTFGLFALGRVFSVLSDMADHEVDHDVDQDVEHDIDQDVEHDIDQDVGHDIDQDIDQDIEHDVEHDVDHGMDLDVPQDVDYDIDQDIEHDLEHGEVDVGHDLPSTEHSGFFESEQGAPFGVTIGTGLIFFGFFGLVFYYEGLPMPFPLKVLGQVVGVALVVYTVRTVLGKAFVESGYYLEPRHLVGRQVEAASTVKDDFGEVRTETEMGLRRFNARPFRKGSVFQKGTVLFIISANDKYVYVDPNRDLVRWLQKQSKKQREGEKASPQENESD